MSREVISGSSKERQQPVAVKAVASAWKAFPPGEDFLSPTRHP